MTLCQTQGTVPVSGGNRASEADLPAQGPWRRDEAQQLKAA